MLLATLADEPRNLPFRDLFPNENTIRVQKIQRNESPSDWPFTIDEGLLACSPFLGGKIVVFVEETENDTGRYAQITVNPIELWTSSIQAGGLIDGTIGMEELIRRMAPLYQTGKMLCRQEPGSITGPGEL